MGSEIPHHRFCSPLGKPLVVRSLSNRIGMALDFEAAWFEGLRIERFSETLQHFLVGGGKPRRTGWKLDSKCGYICLGNKGNSPLGRLTKVHTRRRHETDDLPGRLLLR